MGPSRSAALFQDRLPSLSEVRLDFVPHPVTIITIAGVLPAGVHNRRLEYYARRFLLRINATYYRQPVPEMFERMLVQTPNTFGLSRAYKANP